MWAQLALPCAIITTSPLLPIPSLTTPNPRSASFACAELLGLPGEGHIVTSILTLPCFTACLSGSTCPGSKTHLGHPEVMVPGTAVLQAGEVDAQPGSTDWKGRGGALTAFVDVRGDLHGGVGIVNLGLEVVIISELQLQGVGLLPLDLFSIRIVLGKEQSTWGHPGFHSWMNAGNTST